MELVNEVMLTITDRPAMLGPEGSPASQTHWAGLTPSQTLAHHSLLWFPDEPAVGQIRPG